MHKLLALTLMFSQVREVYHLEVQVHVFLSLIWHVVALDIGFDDVIGRQLLLLGELDDQTLPETLTLVSEDGLDCVKFAEEKLHEVG